MDMTNEIYPSIWSLEIDGGERVIENLELNGTNFISQEPYEESLFTDKELHSIRANGMNAKGELLEEHTFENAYFISSYLPESIPGYGLVINELSASELENRRLWATMDYLAMCSDVEL